MGQLKYKATITDQEWLKNNNFIYSRGFSDAEDPVYIHRFPVYRWGLIATLEGEMRLHVIDGLVTVDVYDVSGLIRSIYAPFYYQADTVHKGFVEEIQESIEKESERLKLDEWDGD